MNQTRRELAPDDLSFLRAGGRAGEGSNRAQTLPSALMRADALYNFSRHAPGLLRERSAGAFIFFDMDGLATPYLLWRRTQAHAIVPSQRSLQDVLWSPDSLEPVSPFQMPRVTLTGRDSTRLHPLGSEDSREWLEGALRKAPLGVDLLISVGGGGDLRGEELMKMVRELLTEGGDVVLAGRLAERGLAESLSALFERVHASPEMIIAQGKLSKEKTRRSVDPLANLLNLPGADTHDPLTVWLTCGA